MRYRVVQKHVRCLDGVFYAEDYYRTDAEDGALIGPRCAGWFSHGEDFLAWRRRWSGVEKRTFPTMDSARGWLDDVFGISRRLEDVPTLEVDAALETLERML